MIYGHDKTIHGTQEVEVERDSETGRVVAVWYRCALLPFTDTLVDNERSTSMDASYKLTPPKGIVAIEFSETPAPKEYEMRGIGMHPKEPSDGR